MQQSLGVLCAVCFISSMWNTAPSQWDILGMAHNSDVCTPLSLCWQKTLLCFLSGSSYIQPVKTHRKGNIKKTLGYFLCADAGNPTTFDYLGTLRCQIAAWFLITEAFYPALHFLTQCCITWHPLLSVVPLSSSPLHLPPTVSRPLCSLSSTPPPARSPAACPSSLLSLSPPSNR